MNKIRIFFLVIFVSVFTNIFSQQIGNEWVSYNQKYLRFHVTEDGVYKIPYDVLKSAFNNINIDIQNLNPAGFQVFREGKRFPIYIKTQNNSFWKVEIILKFIAKEMMAGTMNSFTQIPTTTPTHIIVSSTIQPPIISLGTPC